MSAQCNMISRDLLHFRLCPPKSHCFLDSNPDGASSSALATRFNKLGMTTRFASHPIMATPAARTPTRGSIDPGTEPRRRRSTVIMNGTDTS